MSFQSPVTVEHVPSERDTGKYVLPALRHRGVSKDDPSVSEVHPATLTTMLGDRGANNEELVLLRAGAFLTALAMVAEGVRAAAGVHESGEDISHVTMEATRQLVSTGALGQADEHTVSTALSYARGLGYDLVRTPVGLDNRIDIELLEFLVSLQRVAGRLEAGRSQRPRAARALAILVKQSQPPAEHENASLAPKVNTSQ